MGSKYENLLEDGSGNIVQSFFDNFLKGNAEFRSKAGFRMTVIREGVGVCCAWCQDLVGTYDYDSRPADIYARHKNCTCIVTTRTERGTYQDAWSRKEYATQREARIARAEEIADEIEKDKKATDERKELAERIRAALSRNDIFFSGGRILDPDSDYAIQWARSYYEEIRHKSTDCKKIAERLQIDQEEIESIKDYLFSSGTWYNDITGKYEPFVPDAAIAQSWQRLAEGKEIFPHDKTLIYHERLEMEIKARNPKISHDEAHFRATMEYDYQTESREYYADIRKRKERE